MLPDCPACELGARLNRAARTKSPKEGPIRVFVGAGPEHWLPLQVLRSSILRRTTRDVLVIPLAVVEGTHSIPSAWKTKAPTSFSFQRFLIPAACEYQGFGIYLDSDQIVLDDIGGLWDTPFPDGARVLTTGGWQSAVMLIDAAVNFWEIAKLCGQLDAGLLKYKNLSNLKFLTEREVVGSLDPRWNCMDELPEKGQHPLLMHYTGMRSQPWLKMGHPLGDIWLTELLRTIECGDLRRDDVLREIDRGHVRPSLSQAVGGPHRLDGGFVFPDDVRKKRGAA